MHQAYVLYQVVYLGVELEIGRRTGTVLIPKEFLVLFGNRCKPNSEQKWHGMIML